MSQIVPVAPAANFRLVIHGGAGTLVPDQMSPEREAAYLSGLLDALDAGHKILSAGGTSLDAVTAAVVVLEDNPLFNAGRGSVYTHEGEIEMDAAVMAGQNRSAGAVTGVHHIKNPVLAAKAVLDDGRHVFLSNNGAERFAQEKNLDVEEKSYFHTDFRWKQLEMARSSQKMILDHDGDAESHLHDPALRIDHKYGTVGAVALDTHGNLAAATSTGGMTNKQFGRVGDTPMIGAGTYADNNSVAVSATGKGEAFIRSVAAYRLAAEVELAGKSIDEAAEAVLRQIDQLDGRGGLVVIDRQGNYAMPFNTIGMYRGTIGPDGKADVFIYASDKTST